MPTNNHSLHATVAFGFLMTLSSGFGQTFFISLFNPELRQEFSLSHGHIGTLYFVGTLLSALTVIWLGKLIDHTQLWMYTAFVTIGLAIACMITAKIQSAGTLIVAFFLLRLFGQGLSGHTGITTASRVSAHFRGRSISLVGLGFSAAEIILPLTTVFLIAHYGWRQTWTIYAIFELLVIAIAVQLLLRFVTVGKQASTDEEGSGESWTRSQVIRDKRFWQIVPAIFSPPVISTALFFHQQNLAESKDYTLIQWATGFAAYSIAAVLSSLATGVLVDKYSAAKVVRLYLVPFILSLVLTASLKLPMLPFIYYALIGTTIGIGTPAVSALWLELYGTKFIGSIRALTHACMVFCSALGPLIFGYLLDIDVHWNTILTGSAAWMLLATGLLISTTLTSHAPVHTKA